MVSPRYKGRLFHGPWRDSVHFHGNQYMCGAVWDVEHSLAMASQNIYKTMQMNERRKVWKKNNWFEIKNKTEDRGQSIPKSIGTLTVLRCIFGQNSEILTLSSGDLSTQNGVNFDFKVKFDLEGQGQSPSKIRILTKVFYTYGRNLVILAWTGDELSRGQTWWRTDGRTNGRTDGQTQATTISWGQNWPQAKTEFHRL